MAGLIVVMLVVFIGVAIAKPWGRSVEPSPSVAPSEAEAAPSTPSLETIGPRVPSTAPPVIVAPLPVAFSAPAPPPASATWTGLHWQRLAPDDPLRLVTSVLRWRGGYIALGWDEAGSPTTPIWTSTDGARWQPVPFNTSTTFLPGYVVLGAGEVSAGIVVLTDCGGSPCSLQYDAPLISWTSPDGRVWTPHVVLPTGWLSGSTNSPPLVAVGPAGFIAASGSSAARIVSSADGVEWQYLPTNTLPGSLWLSDLRGTSTGYIAIGRMMTGATRPDAAAFWSPDGRHWRRVPTPLPTSADTGSDVGTAIDSLVVGRDGMVAIGHVDTTPGATLWWQSPDGRQWANLPEFPPLGATTCTGEGCGLQPNGDLAGDGQRLVAIRPGSGVPAWVSTDGRSWQRLTMTGDIPSDAYTATVLPGGVLLTDGTTAWFGEAVVR